jgi:ATP-dependent DNA helicase UvrD/PcrA
LVIDEYQDLNACDLEVLHRIAERGCSIIGAGDDDQSIYSFRRAAPEGIRRFPDDYPGCGDYPLSVTQRCGSRIIEWATYVIEGDPDRPHNRPRLASADGGPPGNVALLAFDDETAEVRGIVAIIQRLLNIT